MGVSDRRDLGVPAVVALWVPLVLGLDGGASHRQQALLGLVTWLLLGGLLLGERLATRVQVGVVVVFATAIEYVFSDWLHTYVYRLDNVPAFVPPGHGLVYLAALCFGRSAFAHAYAKVLLTLTLVGVGLWALWGVTLADRPDTLGVFWFVCLLAFVRWGRSPLLYVGAVLIVTYLELIGTGLGTWTWAADDPVLGVVSMGNPPSGVAGGYAFFDAAALALTPRLLRRLPGRRLPGRRLPGRLDPAAPDRR